MAISVAGASLRVAGIGAYLCAGLLALVAIVSALPAKAGDRALIDFIGYSQDRRYFVFEEYGELDGINTAYSNIYIIDLVNDEFAAGSPFIAEADEGIQQPLAEIRARTHEAARRVPMA